MANVKKNQLNISTQICLIHWVLLMFLIFFSLDSVWFVQACGFSVSSSWPDCTLLISRIKTPHTTHWVEKSELSTKKLQLISIFRVFYLFRWFFHTLSLRFYPYSFDVVSVKLVAQVSPLLETVCDWRIIAQRTNERRRKNNTKCRKSSDDDTFDSSVFAVLSVCVCACMCVCEWHIDRNCIRLQLIFDKRLFLPHRCRCMRVYVSHARCTALTWSCLHITRLHQNQTQTHIRKGKWMKKR